MGDLLFRRAWVVLFLLCASGLPIVSAKATRRGKKINHCRLVTSNCAWQSYFIISLSFFLSFFLSKLVWCIPTSLVSLRSTRTQYFSSDFCESNIDMDAGDGSGRGRMAGRSRARISVRSRAIRNPGTTAGQACGPTTLSTSPFYLLFSFSVHDLLFIVGLPFSSSSTLTLYIFLFLGLLRLLDYKTTSTGRRCPGRTNIGKATASMMRANAKSWALSEYNSCCARRGWQAPEVAATGGVDGKQQQPGHGPCDHDAFFEGCRRVGERDHEDLLR